MHGVRPVKALGQNFVIDPNTIRKVVEVASVSADDRVLEIGAGAGSLTVGLAAVAAEVIAVEFDRRLLPVLAETLEGVTNVEVVPGDAMALPLGGFGATKVVANLPYNIAVPVVVRVLETAPQIAELVVMTQREVGERLAAQPGSKAYGQVSVIVRYFGRPTVAAKVSRRAFFPVPRVDSVLVRIRREAPPDVAPERLFPVVRGAFSQRRKTIRNALISSGFADVDSALAAAGIDPGIRAEALRLDDFVAVANALATAAPPAE
ncbi:MAG: 16S rRNA (adenine(1518)-N(6)/adenine(1519)-N(6))-dimethyltransferase RsmA [Chloroflexota bacterium]|nr:16S rRNA (adenine(1518)-N(6)/adenine(1519)-N(6))-dimethyltransferase RsmA [Chloroflexota bacterium]